MLSNKKVLITNDDGYSALGLAKLVDVILQYTNNILIVAPKVENSAVSHKMTLRRGLRLVEEEPIKGIKTYSLDGTPSDCVKIGILYLGFKPDYVISGINNGLNLGDDILYSGTVAACFEAYLMGFKSIAFSCEVNSFEASKNIPKVLSYINNSIDLKNRMLLNVNMPINPHGIKVTHQGKNPFSTYYEPLNGLLYAKGEPLGKDIKQEENADIRAYHDGFVSITPLTIDRTEF